MTPVFAKPEFLAAGLLVAALVALFLFAAERRAWRRLHAFAAPGLLEQLTRSHSRRRLWVKNILLLLVLLLLFASLARPQWGANWEKSETRGIDIMIALDTSRSMLAEDISPNRLERAKLAILDLLDTLEGDRIGLIAFAGNAFLQCPLTLDYQAFRQTLDAVDTTTIPVGGTDVAAAIDEADAYFEKSDNQRILILITDGEDLEASGVRRAREAAATGTRILTVGVGSPEGELIPVRGPSGATEFLRDASGKPVSTRLDEDTLRRIAEASNGLYAPLGPTGAGLERVYQFTLAQMPARDRQESLQRIPIERFRWPLLAALVLVVAESLLTTRRRLAAGALPSGAGATLLILLALAGLPRPAMAGPAREAARAYEESRYEESVTLYGQALQEDPDDARLLFNKGVSAYRAGDFEGAIASFEETLRHADPSLQAKAFHNAGNSRVAYGFDMLESQPTLARDQWQAAVTDYENALALDDQRADSRRNLEQLKLVIAAHTHTITTAAEPAGAGTVSAGGESFHNIPFPVSAEAAEGWMFSEWTGDGLEDAGQPQTVVRAQQDTSVTAHFVKTWQLTVLSADEAMGTAGTSGTYREDKPVPVKAEARDYFAFSKWTSDAAQVADPSKAETEVTLTGDATVTASFVPAFKLSVVPDPEIGGKAGPSGFFEEYSVVPIQAEPRPGFEWTGWIGDGIKEPDSQQASIALTADRVAIAAMKRVWNLVIIPVPEEGGTVEGAGNHAVGSTVGITATPAEGFTFEEWEGPGVADPASPQTEVTVQSTEHNLFARFKKSDDNQDQQDQNQDQQQNQQQDQQQNQQDQQQQDNQQNQQQQEGDNQQQQEDQQQQQQQDQGGEPEQEQGQAGDEQEQQARAGEMTREEARQLLNALSESERFLPAGERSQERQQAPETQPGRDW